MSSTLETASELANEHLASKLERMNEMQAGDVSKTKHSKAVSLVYATKV